MDFIKFDKNLTKTIIQIKFGDKRRFDALDTPCNLHECLQNVREAGEGASELRRQL